MPSASVVKLRGVPMAVAPWIVSDELWERIEPLLPKVERRFRYPGRKRLPDRQALQGILFVLQTGIAWRHLPLELGKAGRPRKRHERLTAGRGYDHDKYRASSDSAGSQPRSLAARPNTAPAWVVLAGSSSAPSPSCTTSSGCSSATTAATRST